MEIIILPQINLAQLQTLSESVIKITDPLPELAPQVQVVQEAFKTFEKGMIKSSSTSNKKTLDRSRDLINTGFFKSVDAEEQFPYEDAATKSTLAQVVAITDKYGLELSRLPYDEQTAQTDNMIAQLEAIDLSLLPAVARWIALIKTANDNFKVTVTTYLKGQTEDSDTAAASIAAIPLEDALKALFTIHFAHAQVSKTDTLVSAYKELTFLVNSYRK